MPDGSTAYVRDILVHMVEEYAAMPGTRIRCVSASTAVRVSEWRASNAP
jgi:hypothetical protein